ncbi:GbsR/MarR family transcriptional regulator [Actinocatenispora comari]|uniref:MarR family transcriptional regulator n=1 Tax=Actinocatenispora comari TaxID=2807577 RepID=A0A8J4A950_9ACTN|nr:MarR family transcriptional regulator [Actinocatenispora comari]GIL24827.1 MarR family transcriptional regulator [Actinocatenispora comari]
MTRADSDEQAVTAVERYRERLGSVVASLGVPRMPARVFAALFVAESGRLTAAELAETLRVSPAAVSGATRYLTDVGMAFREREPGSRRDHYTVRDDMWQQAISTRAPIMKYVVEALRDGVAVVGTDTHAGRRAMETVNFFEFLEQEMTGLMDRWAAHRASLTT